MLGTIRVYFNRQMKLYIFSELNSGHKGAAEVLRGVPRAGEFGSIPELITLFVRTTRGYLIPPGSLVVIASASQLMAGGLAAYARDLCEAADQFEGIFNGEVDLVPGPPILLGGQIHRC